MCIENSIREGSGKAPAHFSRSIVLYMEGTAFVKYQLHKFTAVFCLFCAKKRPAGGRDAKSGPCLRGGRLGNGLRDLLHHLLDSLGVVGDHAGDGVAAGAEGAQTGAVGGDGLLHAALH